MRIHILAALALMVPACAGEISSTGGGDDGAAVCGNGTVEAGEQCDDGNALAGDGCSATCQTEQVATPALAMSIDKPTISTELHTTNTLTVTLTGSGGFAGTVNLQAAVLDSSNSPLTAWTISFDHTSVDVPPNGTATAVATLTVPSQNMGLTGTMSINAIASIGTQTVSSAVTVANQVTYTMHFSSANATFVYPTTYATTKATPDVISVGTKVRWYNDGTGTDNFVVHIDGEDPAGGGVPSSTYGFTHQGQSPGGLADPTTEPGSAYEQTATAASGSNIIQWYFHDPSDPSGLHAGYFKTVQ